ncbi:VCBS repeat-containing protein, partial [Candidatus Desantisbacteria bacterium]|nr:VCBS repeat-containing protein [Candidatus Desantisbacteria bacterium]
MGSKIYDSAISMPGYRIREGWPKILNSDYWRGPANFEAVDVDADGVKEIIVNTSNKLHVFNPDGTYIQNFPIIMSAENDGGGQFVVCNDFNSDGMDELVISNQMNGKIYLINYKGNVKTIGDFRPGGGMDAWSIFALSTGNFDGDNSPDIAAVGSIAPTSPEEYRGMYVWNANGEKLLLIDGDVPRLELGNDSGNGSAGIGMYDLNNDNIEEIIARSDYWMGAFNAKSVSSSEINTLYTQGWPKIIGWDYDIYCPLAIGNMDNDSALEIVTYRNPNLFVYNSDGSLMGYKTVAEMGMGDTWHGPSISLGDIDGDGKLEVCMWEGGYNRANKFRVIGFNNKEYNFPFHLPDFTGQGTGTMLNFATPVIGDINGDGEPEVILIGSNNIYAYRNTGEAAAGFPIKLDVYFDVNGVNSAMLTDLDGDGKLEIVAAGVGVHNIYEGGTPVKVYVIDTNAWYDPENIEWAQYGADKKHTMRHGDNKGKYWYKLQYARWANLNGNSEGRRQKAEDRIKLKAEFTRNRIFDTGLPVLDKFNIAYTTGKKGLNPHFIKLTDSTMVIAYEAIENGASKWSYVVPGKAQRPQQIALDRDVNDGYFTWMGDKLYQVWMEQNSNGYTLYRGEIGGTTAGDTLYAYESTVSILPGEKLSWTHDFGILDLPGNYIIEGKFLSSIGQTLDDKKGEIRVQDASGISAKLETDKEFYQTGDTAFIQTIVTNKGQNVFPGTLNIYSNNINIYSQDIVIPPGTAESHSTSFICNENFKLSAKTSSTEIVKNIEVIKPEIKAYFDCPEAAGLKTFPVTSRLYNPTKMELNLNIAMSNEQRVMSEEQIIIKPQEWQIVKREMSISEDTDVVVKVTGKTPVLPEHLIKKHIEFGERVKIGITPEFKYPAGKIILPYTINSIGKLDVDGEIEITVVGADLKPAQKVSEKIYIEKNKSKNMQFVGDLTEGEYSLKVKYCMDSTEAEINVVPYEGIEISKVNIGRCFDGLIPVNFVVKNTGYSDIHGRVEAGSVFYHDGREINIDDEEEKNYTFQINPSFVTGGKYPLTLSLTSGSGYVKKYDTTITITDVRFGIEQVSGQTEFAAGEKGIIAFKVKNTGDRAGRKNINIKVADFYQEERSIFLKQNEEKEEQIGFTVPQDLVEGVYRIEIKPEGETLPYVIPFTIKGIELKVTATLDKEIYKPEDILKVNINIENLNQAITPQLYVKVKYDTTSLSQNLQL